MYKINAYSNGKIFCYYIEHTVDAANKRLYKLKNKYKHMQFDLCNNKEDK